MNTIFKFVKRFPPKEYHGKVLFKSKMSPTCQRLILLPIEKEKKKKQSEDTSLSDGEQQYATTSSSSPSSHNDDGNNTNNNNNNNNKHGVTSNDATVPSSTHENTRRTTTQSFAEQRGRFMFYPGQLMHFLPRDNNDPNISTVGFSMTNSRNMPYTFHENELHFAIKLTNHKMTKYIHSNECRVGEFIDLKGPDGSFVYVQPKKRIEPGENPLTRVNLIAGGLGITPLCSIWNSVLYNTKVLPGTNVKLLYSSKQIDDFIFARHFLDSARGHHKCGMSAHFNISDESRNDTEKRDHMLLSHMAQDVSFGMVDKHLIQQVFFSHDNPEENLKWGLFYLCGPPPMVREVSKILVEMGVNPDHVIYEQW